MNHRSVLIPCARAVLPLAMLALGACASLPSVPTTNEGARGSAALPASASLGRESLRLARAGSEVLRVGRYAEASERFNRALKLEPENAQLHFLNALAYHLAWRAGEQRDPELAEAGYLVALHLDPTFGAALGQLGTLYVELKRPLGASAALARAIALRSDDPEALYALAYSAYYAQDPGLAAWAARRAVTLAPQQPAYLRAAALSSAAAGDSAGAANYLSEIQRIDPAAVPGLRGRLERWQSLHAELLSERAAGAIAPVQLAQMYSPPPMSAPAFQGAQPGAGSGFPGQPQMPMGAPAFQGAQPGAGPGFPGHPGSVSGDAGPMQLKWSDCDQERLRGVTVGPSMVGPISGSVGADETAALPALPSPCKGLPLPRMAMVDVTILRTAETTSRAHGVNLLEGLQLVLTGSRTVSRSTTGVPQRQVTQTGGVALPGSGVAYALNLANAAERHAEVIARPTLIALDRTPSNFFSGSNVSVLIQGSIAGGSLSEKPIGVSLSVTPTFVNDDSMLLAVKATRSFIESGSTGTFQQALATTRNAVTANVMLKFDQTLVLSGLRERDQQDTDSGVPLLRDVPIVQYAFGRRIAQDYTKEVVIVLTPRRPQHLGEGFATASQALARQGVGEPGRQALIGARQEARKALGERGSNLDAILAALADNRFYPEFRTGDIRPSRIPSNFSLDRVLREVWDALLF